MLNYDTIKRYAAQAGFDLCGVARCRTLDEQRRHFVEWLHNGYQGGMDYMERKQDLRFDPTQLVPGARTVIVCAVSYNRGLNLRVEEAAADGVPKIASYAFSKDYHPIMKGMLGEMLDRMEADTPGIAGRCFVDTAPVLEKAWAAEAGLGWSGKQSILVTRRHGTLVLLGEIVTDAEADNYDTPFPGERCGRCTRCIDACPTGAIVAPHVVDTRKCISRLTIEKIRTKDGSIVPSSADLHGWIYGCDVCQTACPYNNKALPSTFERLAPVAAPEELGRTFWENLTQEEFDARFGQTPLTRCGLQRIKNHL